MASICRSACRSLAVQTVLAGSLHCFLSATHDSVRHPSLPACRPAGRWAWLMRRPTAASSLKSSRCSTAHTSIKCLRTPSARWAGAELIEPSAVSQLLLRCTASSAVVQSQGRPALLPSPPISAGLVPRLRARCICWLALRPQRQPRVPGPARGGGSHQAGGQGEQRCMPAAPRQSCLLR